MRSLLLSTVVGMSALGLPLAGPSVALADETPATIRVFLPADATLTIDGHATQSTSAERLFVTPPLEAGKDFHYTLQVRFARGDDMVSVERRIAVHAGAETTVRLGGTSAGDPSDAANASFYYSPGAAPAAAPVLDLRDPDSFRAPYVTPGQPPRGGVAPVRTNWMPDFSDPFLHGDNW